MISGAIPYVPDGSATIWDSLGNDSIHLRSSQPQQRKGNILFPCLPNSMVFRLSRELSNVKELCKMFRNHVCVCVWGGEGGICVF